MTNRVFDNATEFAISTTGQTLTSTNAYRNRWSENVVESLRQSGVFSGRFAEPSNTPPVDTTLIWTDTSGQTAQGQEPPVYRAFNSGTSTWELATFNDIWAGVTGDVVTLSTSQTVTGNKTFSGTITIDSNVPWHNGSVAAQIATLTAETALATGDEFPLNNVSGPNARKTTLQSLFNAINVLTAETAPAVDDVLALFDTSGSAADKMTLANLLKVINALTEDTSPDLAADFVPVFDTSAGDVKKVAPGNLGQQFFKAWASVTVTAGTPSVDSSFNVSSITDNGTGNYTINFTNSLSGTDYAVIMGIEDATPITLTGFYDTRATGSVGVGFQQAGVGSVDPDGFSIAILEA